MYLSTAQKKKSTSLTKDLGVHDPGSFSTKKKHRLLIVAFLLQKPKHEFPKKNPKKSSVVGKQKKKKKIGTLQKDGLHSCGELEPGSEGCEKLSMKKKETIFDLTSCLCVIFVSINFFTS